MQCRINAGAADAAASGPIQETGPRSRTRKQTNLLCFGGVFSGWYNFRKIIKIVATRCHILKLKCTKFDFRCGYAPGPAVGAYSAPPDFLAGFLGPNSKGKRGREWKVRGKGRT